MSDSLRERIQKFILENYLFTSDTGALGLDDSLLGRGIVDSTGMLEIIMFIEEQLGVTVQGRGDGSGEPRLGQPDRGLRRVETQGRLTPHRPTAWQPHSSTCCSLRRHVHPTRWHCAGSMRAWTYGDLTRGAAAAATALGTAGLQPGDRVGLLFRNGPEYVAFFYGALAARLAAVPLNVQERASVLALQVAHSGARLVVGDPDHPEWQALRAALPADFPMLPVPSRDAGGIGNGIPGGTGRTRRSAARAAERGA